MNNDLNIDQTYQGGGDFLKADDLKKRRVNLTVAAAKLEELKDGSKIVLDFEGTEKRLVLNKTNARMCAELLNDRNAGNWIGSTITLRPDKTQLQDGRTVDCIRVDLELPTQIHADSVGSRAITVDPLAGQAATAQPVPMANIGQSLPPNSQIADADIPF